MLIFFFCFIIIINIVLNHKLYFDKPENQFMNEMMYLPSGKFLKGITLSYDMIFADLLWIKVLGYFGGHSSKDLDHKWLEHILEIITDLDPFFEYPYEFGGILFLTELNAPDKSVSILKKGLNSVPENDERYWYLPFFLAFNYMYKKNDFSKAAFYLEIASKHPNSPDYLPLLVSKLYAKSGGYDVAEPFLVEIIKNTEDEMLREKLEKRLNEIKIEKNIVLIEIALKEYIEINNSLPNDIKDLVTSGLLEKLPEDPLGGSYFLSDDKKSVINTKLNERLKVYIE
ncbi:MAG: tetratricopeptide repeat protein [Candidatus Muiribacteriota bacterium]